MSSDTRGTDIFDKLHEYGVDLKRRRVFLQCGFFPESDTENPGWTDMVARNLLWLDANSKEPLELWINTPGGAVEEMWAIYDVMKQMRSPVMTIALGTVCSAGCLILAGGTGVRYTHPNASFMWHGGWEGASGVPREVEHRVEFYKADRARWVREMAKSTSKKAGRSLKAREAFWEEKCHAHEFWLDAKGMVEYGIVDEIWTKEEAS